MALPSIYDLPARPDHIRGFGEALGGAAKTVDSLSPAHPLIAQAIRRIYGGEDPRRVAVETKFAMARQQTPPPNLPDAGAQMEPYPEAPARAPRQLRGRMEDVTGMAPGESMGMTGSMRSSMAPPPSSEALGLPPLEETVTAPAPASMPARGGSMPLASEPSTGQAFYSQAQPPILNKDLPMLMQGAGLVRREEGNDLRSLELALRERQLLEKQRQFDEQAGLRNAREGYTRAQTGALPIRLGQADQRLGIAQEQNQLGWANLNQRGAIKYMERASDLAIGSQALRNLISIGETNPEIAPESDYTNRRTAEIMARIPVAGAAIGSILEHVADGQLTQPQRNFRRDVRLYFQTMLIHPQFGASFTANEQAIANELAGGQLSIADTIGAMRTFEKMTGVKLDMWNKALPGAAQQIGAPPRNVIPPTYSPTRDTAPLPNLPNPGIPSNSPTGAEELYDPRYGGGR